MAEGDFGQQPGEIVAADGAGRRAPLIAIEDADAFGGPTPVEGALAEIGLDRSGFAVALDLLGMGLADRDEGPTIQVAGGDLGGPVARPGFSGGHRPPPFRGERRGRRVGAAEWSTGSAGGFAGVASTRASAESRGRA